MFENTVIYICIFFLFTLSVIVIFFARRIIYFRKLSETDQMTQLLNYRGLLRNVEGLIKHKTPFSIAIIDIDNFRIFNMHSYKLGDAVLKEFATLLNETFSEDALIARFRLGDEFVIVFRNSDLEKAKIEIRKFKEICINYKFNSLANYSAHAISFSEGIVALNFEINSIDSLFSEAEKSLKENKANKTIAN
jgi:diguanylate cyclase (GGDEF)-like protein